MKLCRHRVVTRSSQLPIKYIWRNFGSLLGIGINDPILWYTWPWILNVVTTLFPLDVRSQILGQIKGRHLEARIEFCVSYAKIISNCLIRQQEMILKVPVE